MMAKKLTNSHLDLEKDRNCSRNSHLVMGTDTMSEFDIIRTLKGQAKREDNSYKVVFHFLDPDT